MTRGRRWYAVVAVAILALSALSCGDPYPSGQGYTVGGPPPSPTYDGIVGALVEAENAAAELATAGELATAQAQVMALTVQAAEAQRGTADAAVYAYATATAQAIAARATIQALDVAATAQALNLEAQRTATARAEVATATADARNLTATADAHHVQATTQAALALATAQAGQATATAEAIARDGTATAQAWSWAQTTTADAAHAQATTQAGYATGTAQAAQAEREALALQRERVTQPLRTWGGWLGLVLAVAGVGFLGYRAFLVWEIRRRVIERDPRGDAPIIPIPGPGGRLALVDPDRAWGPVTVVDGTAVTAPSLAPAEYQERTTQRDQAIDLLNRGLPSGQGTPTQRRPTPRQLAGAPPAGGAPGLRGVRIVRSIDQATRAGAIPPALAASIEADWTEVQG